MTYRLGVDIGTTYTAAAVQRGDRSELLPLGDHSAEIPSVLFLRADGTFAVGEAAERRGLTEPERVVREFKRRIGDPTPLLVAGSPYSAHALTAVLLRHVVGVATQREGEPPDHVVLCHPANWGPYKREVLQHAIDLADVPAETQMCTEPVAALLGYAGARSLEVDGLYAVYDLGGGTFDAALLSCTAGGVTNRGTPGGIEQLGGVDFDDALFQHVLTCAGVDPGAEVEGDASLAALRRLRRECVSAKELLSHEEDITLQVDLLDQHQRVRITRGEFEDLVRPAILETVRALRRVLTSADIDSEQLTGVLLAGGSSRMPLVSQLLWANLGRPVLLDAHPKALVPLGAARFAPTASEPSGPSAQPGPRRTRDDRDERPARRRHVVWPGRSRPDVQAGTLLDEDVAVPGETRAKAPPTALQVQPPAAAEGRSANLLRIFGAVAAVVVLGLALAALLVGRQRDDGVEVGRPSPDTVGVVRHEGADRYATSTAAALAAHRDSDSAVLATGEQFPDALAAQALAGAIDGGLPFFMTPRGHLPTGTLKALHQLGVTKVFIVGDPTAVSDDVERALRADGIAVSRFQGATRAETADAVARAVDATTVLLADGSDPAAVSLGPIAYRHGWPVLYWSSRGLSADSLELLAGADVQVLLLGSGEHVQLVRSQLRDLGVAVDLLTETHDAPSEAVPLYAVDALGWSGARVTLVADGHADALSAAQLSATLQAPLVVTGPAGHLSSAAERVLVEWPTQVEELIVVGDETTVTPAVVRSVTDAVSR